MSAEFKSAEEVIVEQFRSILKEHGYDADLNNDEQMPEFLRALLRSTHVMRDAAWRKKTFEG